MRLAAALLLLCGTHALTATGPQPVVWSLAGSDSSAGAGVEADLRAFRCLGARGCAVVTALTAQSTTGVEAVLETPAAHVAATIAALEADLPPAAVKTGALGGAGAARPWPPSCAARRPATGVVDPVVVSTSVAASSTKPARPSSRGGPAALRVLPQRPGPSFGLPPARRLAGRRGRRRGGRSARASAAARSSSGGHLAARAPPTSGPTPPRRRLAADRTPGLGAGGAHGTGRALGRAAAALARGERPGRRRRGQGRLRRRRRRAAAHAARRARRGPPPADVPATWPDADAAATFPSAGLEPPLQPFPRLDGPPMTLYALAATAARCAALWDAGVVDVQLRVKDAPPAAIEAEVAAAAQEALARPHARLWVNDFWEAAAGRAGCFGCHLGQEDLAALAPADAARLAASGLRLGVSTHCLAELAVAAALRGRPVALGPVFSLAVGASPSAPRGLGPASPRPGAASCPPTRRSSPSARGPRDHSRPSCAGADAVAVISALGDEGGAGAAAGARCPVGGGTCGPVLTLR